MTRSVRTKFILWGLSVRIPTHSAVSKSSGKEQMSLPPLRHHHHQHCLLTSPILEENLLEQLKSQLLHCIYREVPYTDLKNCT